MNEKLLAILLSWREHLRDRNVSSPPESDLRLIAASNRTWPQSSLSWVTEAWKPTIQYLEKQQRFGVNNPLPHMDDEMWAIPAALQAASESSADVPTAPSESAKSIVTTPAANASDQAKVTDGDVVAAVSRWLKTLPEGSAPEVAENRLRGIVVANGTSRSKQLESFGLSDHESEINLVIRRARAGTNVAEPPATSEPLATPPVPVEAVPVIDQPRPEPEIAVAVAAPSTDGPLLGIDPDRFAPYDFSGGAPDPGPLTVVMTAGKSLQLSWRAPETPSAVNLYRIVAADDEEPWSPESGRLVGVTADLTFEDTERFSRAIRHLQVWCNSGTDLQAAQFAQPMCIAKKAVVCPVLDVSIREEGGTVTGEWDVPEDVACVQVYRVPVERANHGSLSPMYRIQPDEDNVGGFQDSEAERGKRYLYQFVAEAEFDGVRLTSSPVVREQQISVVLSRVNDLVVNLFGDGGEEYFDISWTPPLAGRVVVYRSDHPPVAGIEDEVQEENRLAGAELREEDRLAPVRRNIEPGRDGMRRVPWPEKWARAYFTPVTLHNGRALVGKTAAQTRVPGIHDARLVERVNEQLLTFSWPQGAASVFVYVTRRNTPADSLDFGSMTHSYEISHETWQAQGGLHFVPPLHLDGCSLHLVAVAFQRAQTYRSRPCTVDYAGLRIIRYDMELKRNRLLLRLASDTPTQMPEIDFALVCNGERFPLDIKDGIPIPLSLADRDGADPRPTISPRWKPDGPADMQWVADVGGIRGRYFFRLFPDLPPERLTRIALIDPPIGNLLLDRP